MFNVFIIAVISAIGFCVGNKIYRKLNKLAKKIEKTIMSPESPKGAENVIHD